MSGKPMTRMVVLKRDGSKENISFDKILQRIQRLCWPVNSKPVYKGSRAMTGLNVDVSKIVASVCASIVDGISTVQLDELTADKSASMTTEHPDYGILAARISVSNLQKQTHDKITEAYAEIAHLLNEDFKKNLKKHADEYQSLVDYDRDYDFDYFGFKTMERLYLTKVGDKIVERPQHVYLRVAIGLWGEDIVKVKETYDALSYRKFTHASPTLFNSGFKKAQLASCFLCTVEDSLGDIYKVLGDCAQLSKHGGGLGINISEIRGRGSRIIGTNGESDGIVPMLKVFDTTSAYANQGGRRKGSFAIYLEPHHPDIMDFLLMKRNQGEESLRARNLFYAVWLNDLFMKRVETDAQWSLFDPSECPGLTDAFTNEYAELYARYEAEGKAKNVVKARDVWNTMVTTIIETGQPYVLNKDAVNRKNMQMNAGTIRGSNLCVAGDTKILTSTGYHPIKDMEGKQVQVWNGYEFSETIVHKTGVDQKLVTVYLDDGVELRCTPYHKFYIETGSRPAHKSRVMEVRANELENGDRIIRFELPTITTGENTMSEKEAYTSGFFSADGCVVTQKYGPDTYRISVKREDKIEVLTKYADVIKYHTNRFSTHFYVPEYVQDKYKVPINSTVGEKVSWLAGFMDGDGCVIRLNGIENLQAVSTMKSFLQDIQLMLQTIGIHSTVNKNRPERMMEMPDGRGGYGMYNGAENWRLNIDSDGVRKLFSVGFTPRRLKMNGGRERHHKTNKFTRVVSVVDHGDVEDIYCFNEPKCHMGVFNGVITGQCAEILEYTSKDETSVCVIGSVVLKNYVKNDKFDFEDLRKNVKILAKNLDRSIDVMAYPIKEAETSNKLRRPIGVGVQGLQDVFFKLKLPFDSPEARDLNREIFEHIYYAAVEASVELAEIHGPHPTFEGSPASKGMLGYHLWDVTPKSHLDWKDLEERVKKGVRNSLLTALMPTASTAQICGSVEAFEPITSNLYSRRTLAGEFPVVNSYLVRELIERGTWNENMKNQIIKNGGSIQKVIGIHPSVKAVYKTAWDLSMKSVIDMAADRGAFVDQTQSMNLFLAQPSLKNVTSMLFYGWKSGLKTMSYYVRSLPASSAIAVTLDTECVACSA
jgi:ribonucleotide reductase alpha subunit